MREKLDDSIIKDIFLNVEVLEGLHSQFLDKLQERMKTWSTDPKNPTSLADVLSELVINPKLSFRFESFYCFSPLTLVPTPIRKKIL